MFGWLRCCALLAVLLIVGGSVQCACAGWKLAGGALTHAGINTTISLEYVAPKDTKGFKSRTLWLYSDGGSEVLMPSSVAAANERVGVPAFFRAEGAVTVSIVDGLDQSSSTISLKASEFTDAANRPWRGHLNLLGEDGLPVVYANHPTTAILELVQGNGAMPPTTHINIKDHRGRTVVSRFYKTFELMAGSEMVELPSPGDYELTMRLISDPFTSMPQARYPSPIPIPFGETVSKFEVAKCSDGVTTQSVVGSRVALEELPSTATVVSMDKMRLVGFGRHSNELQRNRWPYVVEGPSLLDMSRDERRSRGVKLLEWQRRLGSSFTPVTVDWSDIQSSPGTYKWSQLNDALSLYRRYMVRPLVTLTGRAAWNNQLPTQTTETLAAWQNFLSQYSRQYMNLTWGVSPWEYPEKTWPYPADYIKLLQATADGLQYRDGKRIPSSPLVTGALTKFNAPYLDAILTDETVGRLDAVAFDLFPLNTTTGPEVNRFHESFTFTERILRRNKADKLEAWVTGTGWPVGPSGVTEDLQANFMVRTHVYGLSLGIDKIYWNSLCDDLTTPGQAISLKRMGLLGANMMPKRSGVAYNLMTYLLSGVTTPTITRQGSATITSFNLALQNNKWPGVIYVAWTDSPQKVETIRLDMKHGGGVYALDYLGAEVPAKKIAGDSVNPIAGTYSVPVGYEPVYIWDAGKPPDRRR